ncbi:MAG: c-type cytochrome [Actinobacteria bacterium]|nr:c-type cytochrome [Actinomycetota bacterium]
MMPRSFSPRSTTIPTWTCGPAETGATHGSRRDLGDERRDCDGAGRRSRGAARAPGAGPLLERAWRRYRDEGVVYRFRRSAAMRAALIGAVALVLTVAGPARAQSIGDADAGRAVFEANCAMCHGQDAAGMMGMHPSLRGAVERLSVEGVEVAIRNGRDTMPPMPAFEGRLTDKEISDVIAYLDALPVGSRNFGPGADGDMMDGMMEGRMWYWLAWTALLLVLVAVIVIGSIFTVRSLWNRSGSGSRKGEALDILKERFARGEIDRDEFEERRRLLDDQR